MGEVVSALEVLVSLDRLRYFTPHYLSPSRCINEPASFFDFSLKNYEKLSKRSKLFNSIIII